MKTGFGNVYGDVKDNALGDVGGDVKGTINGKNCKGEYFLGGMVGYEAGFNEGFNEGICYVLSHLYENKNK